VIDQELFTFLCQRVKEKYPDSTLDPIASARLLKEANKVKLVLSANTVTYASLESLFEGKDFRTKVTREDLEGLMGGIVSRVTAPIQKILDDSGILIFCSYLLGLSVKDIDSMVLVGGGVRVPIIQRTLEEFLGAGSKHKIARNVNGDEAAVLGAGFRAAGLSSLYRVKEISVKDKNLLPVEIWYDVEAGGMR
jgi:hypoxia up-regulated 1